MFFNFLDWLILIASLAAGVAIIWLRILHLKLRTVIILLSASRIVSAAPTISPRLRYSMATVQTEAAVDVFDEMANDECVGCSGSASHYFTVA